MSTLYVKGTVDKSGSLLQQYTGLTKDTQILDDNYFYSIFPGMLTLFQMLIGACTAFSNLSLHCVALLHAFLFLFCYQLLCWAMHCCRALPCLTLLPSYALLGCGAQVCCVC